MLLNRGIQCVLHIKSTGQLEKIKRFWRLVSKSFFIHWFLESRSLEILRNRCFLITAPHLKLLRENEDRCTYRGGSVPIQTITWWMLLIPKWLSSRACPLRWALDPWPPRLFFFSTDSPIKPSKLGIILLPTLAKCTSGWQCFARKAFDGSDSKVAFSCSYKKNRWPWLTLAFAIARRKMSAFINLPVKNIVYWLAPSEQQVYLELYMLFWWISNQHQIWYQIIHSLLASAINFLARFATCRIVISPSIPRKVPCLDQNRHKMFRHQPPSAQKLAVNWQQSVFSVIRWIKPRRKIQAPTATFGTASPIKQIHQKLTFSRLDSYKFIFLAHFYVILRIASKSTFSTKEPAQPVYYDARFAACQAYLRHKSIDLRRRNEKLEKNCRNP